MARKIKVKDTFPSESRKSFIVSIKRTWLARLDQDEFLEKKPARMDVAMVIFVFVRTITFG